MSFMDKKQTAVEFFYWELIQRIDFTPMGGWDIINNILEQAKAMEKEQIMNTFKNGDCNGTFETINAEQYYTSTYGE